MRLFDLYLQQTEMPAACLWPRRSVQDLVWLLKLSLEQTGGDWTDQAALWKLRYSELIGTGRLMLMVGIYWSYQDILPSPHLTTDAFIHCKSQGLFLSQYFTEPAVDWKRSRSFCSRNLNVWFPAEQSIRINLYLAAQCSCKIMFCFSSLINDGALI